MIIEFIRYTVPPARAEEREAAYHRAVESWTPIRTACVRGDAGGCGAEHFVVRIEWDSVEGHQQGFRPSPQFDEFFAAVRPFFDQIQEMKHYQVRSAATAQ